VSCFNNKSSSGDESSKNGETFNSVETKSNGIDIEKIKGMLCEEFPKELVLKYNPDATHIEIEPVDNGSGGILHCNVKLFYGKRDYDFWVGQVGAWSAKTLNPFWQYNPEKNAALYQEIDEFGEKAIFVTNSYQLLILKDGIVYTITPPNNGNRTSSGKNTKEIALEIAKHFKL
jgi:hypothetical protein